VCQRNEIYGASVYTDPANSHAAKTAGLKASATKAKTPAKKTNFKLKATQRAHAQTRRKLTYTKEAFKVQNAQMHKLTHDQRITSMVDCADNIFCRKRNTLLNVIVNQARLLHFAQVAVASLRGAFSGRHRQDEINDVIDQWFHTKLFDLLPAAAHIQVKSARRSSGRFP